jgi:hypothetical protein
MPVVISRSILLGKSQAKQLRRFLTNIGLNVSAEGGPAD